MLRTIEWKHRCLTFRHNDNLPSVKLERLSLHSLETCIVKIQTPKNTQIAQLNFRDPAALINYFNILWLDCLLTLQRFEKHQASFIFSQWPSESSDHDFTSAAVRPSVACEDSKEFLDNVSELSSAPVITQTHDCWQRHTDEEESNALGTSHSQQASLKAKRTQDFINSLKHLVFLISRNICPLWNNFGFSCWIVQLSTDINNHWNITNTHAGLIDNFQVNQDRPQVLICSLALSQHLHTNFGCVIVSTTW